MKRIVAVALALLLVAAVPHAAQAAGPGDATKAAKQALRKQLRQNGVRLHVKRVAKDARVGQGGPRAQPRRVERAAWLFWLDQAPGAGFQHASVLLLVDDRSSRVVRRKRLTWWPELNGRRIFAGARGRKVRPPKPKARAATVPGFANDCIVTIGDRIDPYFLRGMAAMNALGQRHGMPVAAARTVADLGKRIDELAERTPPCTDEDDWAASAAELAKGEELGKALGYAGTHREGDRARALGWQNGRTDDRTEQRPHAHPPQPVPYTISVAPSYRHIGPG